MNHASEIKRSEINRDMFNPQNDGVFHFDLQDIKTHLKKLTPQNEKDKTRNLKQGSQTIRDKIFSKLSAFFNDGNNNGQ